MLQPRIAPLFVSVILYFAAVAPAQSTAVAPSAASDVAPDASSGPAAMLKQIQRLTNQLDLTAEQKSRLDDLFQHANEDLINAAPDLKNASAADKAARYREILDDLRQQMTGILTDPQKQTLQASIQSLRRDDSSATTQPMIPVEKHPKSSEPPPRAAGRNRAPGGGRGNQLLGRLKENLGKLKLTDSEKTQVDATLAQLQSELLALRDQIRDGSVDKADAREKIAAILADGKTQLGTILDSDQQASLRSLMQNSPTDAPPATAPLAVKSSNPPAVSDVQTDDPASAAEIGKPAPEFKLKRIDGQTVERSSSNHHLLVLVFGSLSAPVLRDHVQALNNLREKVGTRGVDFLLVYTKEQHPVGGWELERNKDQHVNVPLAKTPADRTAAARQLHDGFHLNIPIASDTMDDTTAAAYGVAQTVPAFVIDSTGTVAFHQSWLEPASLERAVTEALAAEKQP